MQSKVMPYGLFDHGNVVCKNIRFQLLRPFQDKGKLYAKNRGPDSRDEKVICLSSNFRG